MAIKRSPAGAEFTQLVLDIFRINGKLWAAGDSLVKNLGQTSARGQVMGAIGNTPAPVAVLARRMGLTRQSVQRTVGLLTRKGICAYLPNPDHRRSPLVKLTPRGEEILSEISNRQARWSNEIRDHFSLKEIKQIRDFFGVLCKKP